MNNLTGQDIHDLQSEPPLCPDCAARLNREIWFENLKRINTNGHGGKYKNILKCDDCGATFEFVKSAKDGTYLYKDEA